VTGGLTRLVPRLGEDGEEDRCQNGNDRDHDEQLDQGKSAFRHFASLHDAVLGRASATG
jgi:hypothetical protein